MNPRRESAESAADSRALGRPPPPRMRTGQYVEGGAPSRTRSANSGLGRPDWSRGVSMGSRGCAQRLRFILPLPSSSQSMEIFSFKASVIRKSEWGVVPLS